MYFGRVHKSRWAQNCFYVCTYALICQTCVAIFVPLVLGGDVKKRVDKSGIEVSGDIEVGGEAVNNLWGGYFAKALTAVRCPFAQLFSTGYLVCSLARLLWTWYTADRENWF